MKLSLALLAAVVAFGITAPTSAEARDHCDRRIVGYTAHGYPIYSVYRVIGYDRFGNPIGRWVTESTRDDYCDRGPSYGYSGYEAREYRPRPVAPLPPLPPLPRPGLGLSLFFGH